MTSESARPADGPRTEASSAEPIRLLWLATKSPWPPVDGGRLLQQLTLDALVRRGARVTVVTPDGTRRLESPDDVPELATVGRPPGRLAGVLSTLVRRLPLAIARHRHRAVRAELARLLTTERWTALHVEQVHALANLPDRLPTRVVLRAQNVESDLWRQAATLGAATGRLASLDGARLARWEGTTVRHLRDDGHAVVAISPDDAVSLDRLAGGPAVTTVPPPFPAQLEPAGTPLGGAPSLVLFGQTSWRPNRDAARWFVERVWPPVHALHPSAQLHLFGPMEADLPGVVQHPSPDDSRVAFPSDAVFVVPTRLASGVRMKILESWARGAPVVATTAAARGLGAVHETAALIGDDPASLAAAIGRLVDQPELGRQLVDGGRRVLRERHDPDAVAARLEAIYRGS